MSVHQVFRYIFRTITGTYQVRIDRRGSRNKTLIKTYKTEFAAFEAAATLLSELGELNDKASVIKYLKAGTPPADEFSAAESAEAPMLTDYQQHALDNAVKLINAYIYVYALKNMQTRFKVVIGARKGHKAFSLTYTKHKEAFYSAAAALKERGENIPYDLLIANVKNIAFRS